jgi:ABC-type branched-subunit amino acid transport system substrate-binding protein
MPEGSWSHTYDDEVWPNNAGQREFYQKYRNFVKSNDAMVPSHAAPGYYQIYLIAAAMKKAGTTEALAMVKAMEGMTIDTYWGPLKVRDFDHQILVGNIWAPMVSKPGYAYLVFDASRARHVEMEPEIFTKEEWLAKRKAAGK